MCGSKENPIKVPLPSCKNICYTISKDPNAFKSCEKNCGDVFQSTTLPLPKCKSGCFTISKDPNALKSCKINCNKEPELSLSFFLNKKKSKKFKKKKLSF